MFFDDQKVSFKVLIEYKNHKIKNIFKEFGKIGWLCAYLSLSKKA